jgi:uncharacterized protein YbaP (TraB family)
MRSRSFNLLLGAMLGTVLTAAPAGARAPEPALWQIKNGDSTVYLLGSIHVLPTNWGWRTKPINAAISSADVLVFESLLTPYSLGQTRVFVRQNGTLPRGKHLSTMLSPQGLEDFKAVLATVPIDADSINVMRPWLAGIILADARIVTSPTHVTFGDGVDAQIEAEAHKAKKAVHYLESMESLFNILVAASPDNDIKRFEANLHELRGSGGHFNLMLESWTSGNQTALGKLTAEDVADHPEEMHLVLDQRNRNWMPQIESMLAAKRTTFITVGAAHLVGPGSVMEMLCKRGWKVQRIKTGATDPPPACPIGQPVPAKTPSKATEVALRP